jgi:hypothetical protein
MPLASLLGALSPLMASRQYDFRLVAGLAEQAPGLGLFAPLLEANRLPPLEVAIVPEIVLADAKPAPSARRCVGLLEDGRVLRMLPLLCDARSVAPGGFALAGEIALDGGSGWDAAQLIEQADARSMAVLGFAPEETLRAAERAIEAVDALRSRSGRAGQRFFGRIVVSTSRALLARAR